MGNQLQVGNLAAAATVADLLVMFSRFGIVKCAEVLKDAESGRSKGVGRVEMASHDEAESAIDMLNFTEYEGLVISVSHVR